MKLAFRPFIFGSWATPYCRYVITHQIATRGSRYHATHHPEGKMHRPMKLGTFHDRQEAEAACQAHADRQQVAA